MTENEIKNIVNATVDKTMAAREQIMGRLVNATVKETLLTLGLDVSDPMKIQADFRHLRVWRESIETVRTRGLVAAVGIIISGIAAALWVAVHPVGH